MGVCLTQTIYIDVLLCVNLIINYMLLSAVSFYTHVRVSMKRLMLGSAVGALCALVILLPELNTAVDLLVKAAVCVLTVFAAYGRKQTREFAKLCVVFLIATFFFGGIVMALWLFLAPGGLVIKNSVVYADISPFALIVCCALCFCAFKAAYTIAGKYSLKETYCTVTIVLGANALRITAKIDTGNSLTEPFSQCPVIVVGKETAKCVTPKEVYEYETVTTLKYREQINSVRFVPFSSVGGEGLLPCFRAQKVYINDIPCDKEVYIALCDNSRISGEFQALVPYDIL